MQLKNLKKKVWSLLLFSAIGVTLFGQTDSQRIMWTLQKDSCILAHNERNKGINQSFNFVIKFSENKILISNVNSSVADMDHRGLATFGYDLGEWYENDDTIFIKILERGRMSPSGEVKISDSTDVDFKNSDYNEIRFLKLKSVPDNLILIPLDGFLFAKKDCDRPRIKYGNSFDCLKIGQPFTLKKADYKQYGMEFHLMRWSKYKPFFYMKNKY